MITAKLSSKNQTVLPLAVRQVLEVGPGDEIAYEIDSDSVKIVKAPQSRSRKYTLNELVDAITPENLPDEHFDDGPMGSELI